MKKILFTVFVLSPLALFANEDVQTDIVPRVVNFVIFAAIVYYLLADKLKTFFVDRTKSIQNELDEVQKAFEDAKNKVEDAKDELAESEEIAKKLVSDANDDVETIKNKIAATFDVEIEILEKSFDGKLSLETKKAKIAIVDEVLNELLSNDNMSISQDDLVNIVLKKVS